MELIFTDSDLNNIRSKVEVAMENNESYIELNIYNEIYIKIDLKFAILLIDNSKRDVIFNPIKPNIGEA